MRRQLALTYINIGEACSALAERAKTPASERPARWGDARSALQRGLGLMTELRDKGALLPEDAAMTEQVARKIAACDVALTKLAKWGND